MVNFTCNKCGESLRKKDVATHFARQGQCRQASSVSCIDCLQEFGQNYVSHTVCITEGQRYSANGLKGVEKSKNQVWAEAAHAHLRSTLETKRSSLSSTVVTVIEKLLNIPSLPKKEKPFCNILKNFARFTDNDIRYVWNIVSEFAKQQDNESKVNSTPKTDKSTAKGVTTTTEEAPSSGNKKSESTKEVLEANGNELEEGKSSDKKKKKSKKTAVEQNGGVEGETTEETSKDVKEAKNQKRKRVKSETADVSQTDPDTTAMEVEEQNDIEANPKSGKLSKKEKKQLKKKEKYEAEMKALEAEKADEEPAEDVKEEVVEEGKKKKKSKKQAAETEENVESDKKNKKKRERTVSMAVETDQPKKKNKQKENDENTEPNEEADEVAADRKAFNWADVIVQVLQSQDNNEMSVKRLCKKVVNEYLSSLLEGAHVDEVQVTAKFQKKLHKTPGVCVLKDKAKLKANDN